MFGIILARLYILATGGLHEVSALSEQYLRRIPVASRRGQLMTSSGEFIGITEEGFITVVLPHNCTEEEKQIAVEKLAECSELSESDILRLFDSNKPFSLEVNKKLTGKCVRSFSSRKRGGSEAVHILGYSNSDGNGVCGLEKCFDDYLSGESSGGLSVRYSADLSGSILEGGSAKIINDAFDTKAGVVTTLDKALQSTVEKTADALLESGAIIVTDMNGGILASASRPAYKADSVADYLESDKGEFVNRALSGFAPGSLFKTVVAAAAIELDESYFDKTFVCDGYVVFGNVRHYCHRRSGHGEMSMKDAFANSCNCYFIKLGLEIGLDRVFDMAEKMGIGKENSLYGVGSYGSRFPRNASGIYPPSMTANCVIGQGEVLVSPIEAAKIMTVCATGYTVMPHVVKGFLSADGIFTEGEMPEKIRVLSEATVEKMREMLALCVSSGTGKAAMPSRNTAGGKTATAQTGRIGKSGNELNHIWFAGIYPVENPEIAVVVLRDFCEAESSSAKWAFRGVCEEYELIKQGKAKHSPSP